jgi:DNA ligase (NAD+)
VVVSGVFESFSRDELKALIETLGGQNVSSISSKTTYVVAGEGMGPSKKAKAEKLGIPVLNEEEFKALIQ